MLFTETIALLAKLTDFIFLCIIVVVYRQYEYIKYL